MGMMLPLITIFWGFALRIILGLLLLCWGLLGCNRFSSSSSFIEDKPSLPTNVHNGSDAAVMAMYKKLTEKGVQIETMGQEYLISIPAQLLFYNQSPRIQWQAYDLLNDVVCYLQLFRKITLHVNAYGSCYRSRNRMYALTLARAKVVGNYLWSQNIESRMVFTEGLGDDKPIVALEECSDASVNARIEIVFRQALA